MEQEWRFDWIGKWGDSEVFKGTFAEVCTEVERVHASGLAHPDEEFTITPPKVGA